MYAPRSEADNLYTRDDVDDFKHGIGDPEQVEQMRDKKIAMQEGGIKVQNLPHLQMEVQQQEPMPESPEPMSPGEDAPVMDDDNENAVGAEVSQLTGMPGSQGPDVSQAIGAQTNGVLGGYRPIATGEPMEDAWSSLLKDHGRAPWSPESVYQTAPGGRDPWTATHRQSKYSARDLHHEHGKPEGGLMDAPLAVGMDHLSTKQPKKLDPGAYKHWMGQTSRKRTMGGMALPRDIAGHGQFGETNYQPKATPMPGNVSKPMSSPKQFHNTTEPRMAESKLIEPKVAGPKMTFKSFKDDLEVVQKNMNYLHFSQIRRLLRDLKDKLEAKEKQNKAFPTQGKNNEAGHRDGGTTNPQGGTESIQADENASMGASGRIFVGLGSGRTP
jgi:hypothetical protein